MGSKLILFLYLIFVVTLLGQNQAAAFETHQWEYGVSEGSLRPQECAPRCSNRCSQTAYKKPCLFFCQKCCAKCLCVPAGTYGNKQTCPCYNNWKTKRGGPKCP
ncbi:hypothetical protein ACS0TY_005340 [Phlomoides rotata]